MKASFPSLYNTTHVQAAGMKKLYVMQEFQSRNDNRRQLQVQSKVTNWITDRSDSGNMYDQAIFVAPVKQLFKT